MDILSTIIAQKKIEVAEQKQRVSLEELYAINSFNRPVRSLLQSLNNNPTGIIAEFKRKSPSKGVIHQTADVGTVTQAYAAQAAGISVLTDARFFGGTTSDLQTARTHQVPILRKDFIIEAYQIAEARAMGADVILLIAACLTPEQVTELAAYAHTLKLEVLLEIHDVSELTHIGEAIDIIGINNRNLKNFEVDIEHAAALYKKVPAGFPVIAESGIRSVDMLLQLKAIGFKGFLIGEQFMRASDPVVAFNEFVAELKTRTNAD